MAKPGLPLAAAGGSSHAWRSRVALGQRRRAGLGRAAAQRWVADRGVDGRARRIRHVPAPGGGADQPPAFRAQHVFAWQCTSHASDHGAALHPGRWAAFMTVARRCPEPGRSPPGVSQQSVSAIFRSFYKSIDVNCGHGCAGASHARSGPCARPEPGPCARPAARRGLATGGVQEIADRAGLHPNTARFHLDALVDAGLAARAPKERTTPGRPSMAYRAVEGGGPRGGGVTACSPRCSPASSRA